MTGDDPGNDWQPDQTWRDADDAGPVVVVPDDETERRLLGAIMVEPSELGKFADRLGPHHFGRVTHATIYSAMLEARRRNGEPDVYAVLAQLRLAGNLERIQDENGSCAGTFYVQGLFDSGATGRNAEHDAGLVIENAARRRAIRQLDAIKAKLAKGDKLETVLDAQRAHLEQLAEVVRPTGETPLRRLDLEHYEREGVPAVDWLVKGWLITKGIVILAGDEKVGKSIVALALAQALARGENWCGLEVARACRVLVVDAELPEFMTANRAMRLGGHHENLFIASGQSIELDSPDGVARLEWGIREFRPDVVFLDTLQRVSGGLNENDTTDAKRFMGVLLDLRNRYGCGFVLVHHRRKGVAGFGRGSDSDSVRGSTVFRSTVDALWIAKKPKDGRMPLKLEAQRYGPSGITMLVELDFDGDEGPITLTGLGEVEPGNMATEAAEEAILATLGENGRMPRGDIEAALRQEHSRPTVGRALKDLQRAGHIRRPKRGFYELCLGNGETK